MATISNPFPDLSSDLLTLYHTTDPLLFNAPVFAFIGPVATSNSVSSSRIQATLWTPAGFQTYPRITVSPAAPLYAAVNHLPREKQGDETCRGLAVSLLKYFAELSEPVKNTLIKVAKSGRQGGRVPNMFDEMHAAELANRMVKVENSPEVIRDLQAAFADKTVPWVDIDVTLPAGSITLPQGSDDSDKEHSEDPSLERYGQYDAFVKLFGELVFLPTSKLRRKPSQPTNVSRSRQFTAHQKESLRLAMCEVVDTEERYISKIYDLVHNVVEEFRQKSRLKGSSSTSPCESALAQLFPPCLNGILDVNMNFLNAIRQVLEETEKDAMEDISSDTNAISGRRKDPIGAVAFAKTLLEWFPRFTEPYVEYLRAHTGFSQVLNDFLKDNTSSFSKRVHETGEQRLRSMLMEPVQRLPRYSLLIDAMTNALPSTHPAVKIFLKARDVITDICSLDSPSSDDHSRNLKRLQELVSGWPSSVIPSGRMITAVDFAEIAPPYRLDDQTRGAEGGIMLLYQDCVILIFKTSGSRASARGLLADLDKPASNQISADSGARDHSIDFMFSEAIPIQNVRFSQSACGRMMYLTLTQTHVDCSSGPKHDSQRSNSRAALRALVLTSAYDGKATRLIEEIVKARIAGRFLESERDNGKWDVRSPTPMNGSLGILAAIFEEDQATISGVRQGLSNVRVVFDRAKGARSKLITSCNLEIIASVSLATGNRYRLEMDCLYGNSSTDVVSADDLMTTFSKRLTNLLRPTNQSQNPVLTEPIVHSNFDILRSIGVRVLGQAKTTRSFRPPSPSKILSNLLNGGQSKDTASPSKHLASLPVMGVIPRMPPPNFKPLKADAHNPIERDASSSKITLVGPNGTLERAEDPLQLLEQTFTAYMLALRSRSGNIVGRTLRGRAGADEVAVNELYNILLEDAARIQAAAEVSVDVLFMSFEKFMDTAWRDQIGPVIPSQNLRLVQSKFDALFPGDFEDFFQRLLGEMAPQNRRALTAMIKLLADLLDASGNDGDRGALTAAFAELLTQDGNPLEYISLLDRLVEDFERLFDDTTPIGASSEGTVANGSMSWSGRAQSVNTGSMTSNTSSFRKRFGFGLSRENSKNESESKVSSIIRSLSKAKGPSDVESQPPSVSKGSLLRSKSTDTDARIASMLRPASRERPGLLGAFGSEEQFHRPNSAHNNLPALTSIGEAPANERPLPPKKKRRSSLSDLREIAKSGRTPQLSPVQLRKPITPVSSPEQKMKLPETPSPTKISKPAVGGTALPARAGSTTRIGSPTRIVSPNRKENMMSPPTTHPNRRENILSPPTPTRKETIHPPSKNHLAERSINRKSDEVVVTTFSPKKRTDLPSNIPGPRGGLRERRLTANSSTETPAKKTPSSSPQKIQKLKMQSPQKLRERLATEKRAQATAESSLQAELSKIGEEISALKLSPSKSTPSSRPSPPSSTPAVTALQTRVTALESRLATLTSDLLTRTSTIENDISTSLTVSERRAKKLDELYREANAENEALYERFNAEIMKLAKGIKGARTSGEGSGDRGEAVLRDKLREALDEVGRVKRENWALRREVGVLRVGSGQSLGSEEEREKGEGRVAS